MRDRSPYRSARIATVVSGILRALSLSTPAVLLDAPATLAEAPEPAVLTADIPAEPLAQALEAFARQTGLQLVYVSDVTRDRRSHAVPRGLGANEALTRMLEGTGLKFEYLTPRSIRILVAVVGPPRELATKIPSGEELQEMIVTAQRRVERAVDVPIMISSISQQELVTANVQTLSDIQKLTPALRFDNQSGFFQPSIRGIGSNVVTSGGGSNVGIYIDGFYSPNPIAADFQLPNVTNIQVLKGPQGTLFGHNTTGGAILVSTLDPSTEPLLEGSVSYGRFNSQKYQAYATGGSGIVAADIEGTYATSNNFVRDIISGVYKNNYGAAYENWTVRTGLKFQLTDAVSVLFRYSHTKQNDLGPVATNSNTDTSINPTTGQSWGTQTFTPPGYYTTNTNQIAASIARQLIPVTDQETMTVRADLGFANLISYTQYRQEITAQSVDLSQIATGPMSFGAQLGVPIDDYTTSQEFLLTSKPGGPLQWTAGLFYLSYRDTYYTFLDFFSSAAECEANDFPPSMCPRPRAGGSSTTTQNIAGYLDATYELIPKLFLTGGVRYAHDAVIDAYYNNGAGDPNQQIKVPSINSTKTTPRAVLRYALTDNSSVYASFAEGYKAAILDVGGSCQDSFDNYVCNNVKPEDVHAYEVGYKIENRHFSNEAAAFLYNYKNLQVSEQFNKAAAYIVNAAQSRIYGLEDDFHFNLNEHFQVNAAGAWTHARYLQFGTVLNGVTVGAPIYATCPANLADLPPSYSVCEGIIYAYLNTSNILHQVPMQHAPDYTATLGPRVSTGMTHTGEYALSSAFYYTSKIFMAPCGCQFLQPAYITLDVRGQWTPTSKKFYVAVFGQNVTNDRWRNQVQYNGLGIGAGWSQPAVWGIEFGAKSR